MRIGKTIIVIDVPIPAEIAPLRFAPPRKTEGDERDRSPRTPIQTPIPVKETEKVEG